MPKQSYGIGYQGSKNRIATLIMNELPAGKRFVDLMAGGCAMTHCAALSGKYDKVLCNDKYSMGSRLFRMAVNGELSDPKYLRWVSREEFHAEKNTDPFVRFIWSFGCGGDNYFTNPAKENWLRATHYAAVHDDWTFVEQSGAKQELVEELKKSVEGIPVCDWNRRRREMEKAEEKLNKKCVRFQPLLNYARLLKLNVPNKEIIEFTENDYRDYQHEEGDVVYCDPPYCGYEGYRGTESFDHVAFYDWLRTRDYPVYFSEYTAPEDFISIWQKDIVRKFSGGAGGSVGSIAGRPKATEHLYIHRKWLNGEIERIVEQIVENTQTGEVK